MTRFLLCGGNDRAYAEFSSRMQDEINDFISEPRMLAVMFASPDNERNEKFQSWKKWWEQSGIVFADYMLANADNFLEQIAKSNIVFFHGGDNQLTFNSLEYFGDLSGCLHGKLVIGSSAGAFWLSKTYFSRSAGEWKMGKNIVPYNIMCHYGVSEQDNPIDDWQACEKLITKFNGDKPDDILKIREGQVFAYEDN